MYKPLKLTLIVLGAIVAVLAAGIAYFAATFDVNQYKDEAAKAVRDATGRELVIKGDLELELFPWLALRAGHVELGNAAGFDGPFASFEGFEAKVKVMPLLRRQVEIGAIVLRGAKIALAVDATGHDNWTDLLEAQKKSGPAAPTEPGIAARASFSVEGVVIEGAALDYRDARDGSRATLSDLALRTTSVTATDPVEVEGSAAFALTAPEVSGKLKFSFTRAPEGPITGLKVKMDAVGAALPAPLKDGEFTIARVAAGEPLTIDQMHFEGWGLALDGSLAFAGGPQPKLTGHLAVAPFSPREVFPALGIAVPKTADPKALTRMGLGFDLEQQGDRLALDKLKLVLDASTVSGRIVLESIAHRALRFDLALDALDADRYLSPPAPITTDGAPVVVGGLDALKLETAWLRGLDVAGSLHAGKLAVAKLDLSDLRIALSAKDGVLTLKPFGAALYGGKVQGSAVVDARGATPAAHLTLALAGVRIGDLLADGFDTRFVSGNAKLDADLTGAGATVGEVKHALDGKLSFRVEDGALEGFNVWKRIRLAWAKFKGRPTSAESEPDRTTFEEFTGGATIVAGVATLEGVRAAIQFADATAKGKVDLGAGTLKVDALAKVNAAPEFGPDENLSRLKNVNLALSLSGPLAKPKVDVDLTKAAITLMDDEKLKKKLKGIHF